MKDFTLPRSLILEKNWLEEDCADNESGPIIHIGPDSDPHSHLRGTVKFSPWI